MLLATEQQAVNMSNFIGQGFLPSFPSLLMEQNCSFRNDHGGPEFRQILEGRVHLKFDLCEENGNNQTILADDVRKEHDTRLPVFRNLFVVLFCPKQKLKLYFRCCHDLREDFPCL